MIKNRFLAVNNWYRNIKFKVLKFKLENFTIINFNKIIKIFYKIFQSYKKNLIDKL